MILITYEALLPAAGPRWQGFRRLRDDLSGWIDRNQVHDWASSLQEVRSSVGGLDSEPDRMRKARLCEYPVYTVLAATVTEAGTQTVRYEISADSGQESRKR